MIAVYTYFDGMDDVRRAVAVEGFARRAQQLAAAPRTTDPVADVAAMGLAYLSHGVKNPDLYRFSFQQHTENLETDASAFTHLLEGVQRAVDGGRFTQATETIALQLWVTTHGLTSLYLAGLLTLPEALTTLNAMGPPLFLGFGDTPDAALASVRAAAASAGAAFPALSNG